MDDSSSSTEKFENKDNWPDVEELVNQRGDETTVYLLADGRYMDRINAVYIYDGKTIPKSKISNILKQAGVDTSSITKDCTFTVDPYSYEIKEEEQLTKSSLVFILSLLHCK